MLLPSSVSYKNLVSENMFGEFNCVRVYVSVHVSVRVYMCTCESTSGPSGLLDLFNTKCGLYIHQVCMQKYK